jgi:hypothetical protein
VEKSLASSEPQHHKQIPSVAYFVVRTIPSMPWVHASRFENLTSCTCVHGTINENMILLLYWMAILSVRIPPSWIALLAASLSLLSYRMLTPCSNRHHPFATIPFRFNVTIRKQAQLLEEAPRRLYFIEVGCSSL